MPATSKQQQKLFGLALSVKRGDTPRSEVSDDVLGIVDKMSEKEIEDFASTDHKGLPTKKEEIDLNFEKAPYAKNLIELKSIWRKRLKLNALEGFAARKDVEQKTADKDST